MNLLKIIIWVIFILLNYLNLLLSQDLELKINVKKDMFYYGEPIIVSITITNISDKPVRINPEFALRMGHIQFLISDNKGKTYKKLKHDWSPYFFYNTKFRGLVLHPYSSYSQDEDILLHTYIVEKHKPRGIPSIEYFKPGEYKIKCMYIMLKCLFPEEILNKLKVWTGELKSNALDIKILKLPENEVRVFSIYKKSLEYQPVSDKLNILNSIINKYPNSLFAKYSYFALFRIYKYRTKKSFENKRFRKDYDKYRGKVIQIYKEILTKYPEFYYINDIKYEMGILYTIVGEEDKSKKIFNEILANKKFTKKNNIELLFKDKNNVKSLYNEW